MGSWSCSTSSTMALYVTRDTLELLGSMMPHLCGPSKPAASTVHSGIPNSSGAAAMSRTAKIAEIKQLVTLRWRSVSSLNRRASEVGRCGMVVAAVHTPVCGACPTLSRHATSESLSWLASGQRRYESTPVCAKPSYWMRRDGSEFIHEFTWKWTALIE